MLQGHTEGHTKCEHITGAAQKHGTSDLQILALSVSAGLLFFTPGQFCLMSVFLMAEAARKGEIHHLFFSLASLAAPVDPGEMRSWYFC